MQINSDRVMSVDAIAKESFMATDWKLVRRLVNSAIDACEALDQLDVKCEERGIKTRTAEGVETQPIVWDWLQSAHVYPENVRYQVIRGRGELNDAAPYVEPISRIIQQVGELASELVGAQELHTPLKQSDHNELDSPQTLADAVEGIIIWYEKLMIPNLRDALTEARDTKNS
jgi:hypothetical protein